MTVRESPWVLCTALSSRWRGSCDFGSGSSRARPARPFRADRSSYRVVLDGDTLADLDPDLDQGSVQTSIPGPDGSTTGAGVLSAHSIERAVTTDRCARLAVERNAAVVTAETPSRCSPGDVSRRHRQQVAAPRSSCVPASGRRREHAQGPARVRARDHLPLRPVVRLQRVLQVLQERRERAVQVHPDGDGTHYDGSVSHVSGIVNICAEDYEAMPTDSTVNGSVATFPTSQSRWTGSSTRSRRSRTGRYSATSRSSGFHWTCIALAMRRTGSGSIARPSDHPFASSPVAGASAARSRSMKASTASTIWARSP